MFWFLIGIAVLLVLLLHIIFVEKIFKKEAPERRTFIKDILGAPLHTLFVIFDSFLFMGIYNFTKDMTKEDSIVLIVIGIVGVIGGALLYRGLYLWYKDKLDF